MNLAPLATQLEALRLTPPAQISPALDDLYALLGQPPDPAAVSQADALVAEVLGATSARDTRGEQQHDPMCLRHVRWCCHNPACVLVQPRARAVLVRLGSA